MPPLLFIAGFYAILVNLTYVTGAFTATTRVRRSPPSETETSPSVTPLAATGYAEALRRQAVDPSAVCAVEGGM